MCVGMRVLVRSDKWEKYENYLKLFLSFFLLFSFQFFSSLMPSVTHSFDVCVCVVCDRERERVFVCVSERERERVYEEEEGEIGGKVCVERKHDCPFFRGSGNFLLSCCHCCCCCCCCRCCLKSAGIWNCSKGAPTTCCSSSRESTRNLASHRLQVLFHSNQA